MTYNSLANTYFKNILLREYTESTIQELITKFTPETTDTTGIIRTNILNFEKIKDSDRFKKLMPTLLPHIKNISDLKTYNYKDVKSILNWFASDSQNQKVTLEPQELPGKPPERLPQGDAVGLEIYVAHNYEQARYLALEHFGRYYPYCVRVRANWNNYRYTYEQTFYFVYDPDKDCSDPNHLLVIRPSNRQGHYSQGSPYSYNVSNGVNADTEWVWERSQNANAISNRTLAIIEQQPKLRTLKDIIVPLKHTARELKDIEIGDKSPQSFKNLDYYTKSTYISLGKLIYAEDYALIDKDLQNDYINSQDQWENLHVTDENGKRITVLGFYSLLYPFAIHGDSYDVYGNEVNTRKILGLYILLKAAKNQDLSPLLNIHSAIANGTGPAKKRYLFLLERNREKLFGKALTYARQYVKEILKIRNDKNVQKILNGAHLSVLDIIPLEKQQEYMFEKMYIITSEEFNGIDREYQKKYIQEWFKRKGGYNTDSTYHRSSTLQAFRPITAPFIDISAEDSNAPINDSDTIEEYVDKHPGFKSASKEIKDEFINGLREFTEKEE
jgi:hypothetical protein